MFSLVNKNYRIEGTLSCTRTGDAVSSRGAFPLLSGDIAKALLVGSLQSLELKYLFGSLCVLLYSPDSRLEGLRGPCGGDRDIAFHKGAMSFAFFHLSFWVHMCN